MLNEASAEEKGEVTHWLEQSESNLAYYNEFKKVWDVSRELALSSTVDENKAWERFAKRIHERPVIAKKRSMHVGWMKIAASIIVLLAIGAIVYWQMQEPVRDMIVGENNAVVKDTLSDGSVVTINSGSSIYYPSRFTGNTRRVKLSGEAFFAVAPDRNKPFVISSNDVQVTVVGTAFNVKSTEEYTDVIVESGIVRVTKGSRSIELHANEKVRILAQDSVFTKEAVNDHLYNYYRTKKFVCDDTPLWKLVEVINEAYNSQIVFGDERLKDLSLTATFNNESLDQVLDVIRLTFNISVTKNQDQIILH